MTPTNALFGSEHNPRFELAMLNQNAETLASLRRNLGNTLLEKSYGPMASDLLIKQYPNIGLKVMDLYSDKQDSNRWSTDESGQLVPTLLMSKDLETLGISEAHKIEIKDHIEAHLGGEANDVATNGLKHGGSGNFVGAVGGQQSPAHRGNGNSNCACRGGGPGQHG